MLQDFDHLVSKVKSLDPYLKVKKQLFGYDILDSLQAMRSEVGDCQNLRDFHLLAVRAMNSCINGHSAVLTPFERPEVNLFIPLMYRDGSYFIKRSFRYGGKLFRAGSRLTSINGQESIHDEVAAQIPFRYLMRWDNERKVFYSELFFWSMRYIEQGQITLSFADGEERVSATFSMSEKPDFLMHGNVAEDHGKVVYFDAARMLYIRVPTMDWGMRHYYRKQISKVAKGRDIDKVVIDVRNNTGGSSIVGRNIMRSILSTPLHIDQRIFGNEPVQIPSRYRRVHGFVRDIRPDTLPELGGLVSYSYLNKKETILPFRNSIRHRGPIYIIGNEHVYSAGAAIFMFANISETDNIHSVGTPTGWFLGEFSDPVQFKLPNSALTLMVSPTFSLTDVVGWDSVMLDSYEYTVFPTAEEYEKAYGFDGDVHGEDYLLKYDPYLRPVIGR